MRLSKYLALGKITFKERFSFFWDKLFYSLIIAIILFVFLNIWKAAYAGKATIEGFSIAQMIWYLAVAETIMFATGTTRIEEIGEEIRSGSLSNTLLKPWSFIGKELSVLSAGAAYTFLTTGIIGAVMAYLLVGPIEFSIYSIPFLFLIFILAILLNFLIVLIFGVIGLWMEDSASIFWMYQKALFIVGGMLLPLDFYPDWLQKLSLMLPVSYVIYLPAKLSVHFDISKFATTIALQAFWIILVFIILWALFSKGVRRVSINGG